MANGMLSGGQYFIGGTLTYTGGAINRLAAGTLLTLAGSSWKISGNGGASYDALANFSDNFGTLEFFGGANLSTTGDLTNEAGATIGLGVVPSQIFGTSGFSGAGQLTVNGGVTTSGSVNIEESDDSLNIVKGKYTQTAGITDVNGTLMAPTVNINGGTLSGNGTIQSNVTIGANGTLSPGDAPGTIHITGPLNIAGTLDEAIASFPRGYVAFDVTDITGQLTLGSSSILDVMLGTGFDPGVGTSLTIMEALT